MGKDSGEKPSVESFIDAINKTYDSQVLTYGGKFEALKVQRFSTGILSLDVASGGGWPFGRVVIIAGEESTGKTLQLIKASNSVYYYDHFTKKHLTLVENEDAFEPGTSLIVDVEGTWDADWAIANGFDDSHHVVARVEHAEQAIDVVTKAISDNVFDLICVDSLAAFAPTKEIEDSAEDWQMGLSARLINKGMRKWNSQLNKVSQHGTNGPCVICLNQFRIKIGQFFGDPRVLPGGRAQRFVASIIGYTKSPNYGDGDLSELSEVTLGGVLTKNKVYVPRKNYAYKLGLRGPDKGKIDNIDQMMTLGKKYKLINVTKSKVSFGKREFKTQKEMQGMLEASQAFQLSLWRSIVKAECGVVV